MEPIQYKDWSPTTDDLKGYMLYDYQEWYIVPAMRTRDSEELDVSNFETAKRLLYDSGHEYYVARFNHWGPGWFEVILTPTPEPAVDIASRLEDYPVLDDDDFYRREYEAAEERWVDLMSMWDRIEMCVKNGLSRFAARRLTPPTAILDDLRTW